MNRILREIRIGDAATLYAMQATAVPSILRGASFSSDEVWLDP